jgi:DNA-binding winged helix-turn-helix (wHTH) protein/TolB-like protein/Flp pilus assembly protein TadD
LPKAKVQASELSELQIGDWTIVPAEGTLCSNGRAARLEPRVMDVLVYLAEQAGRVVSKEDLIVAVWNGGFVEDGALSQAIHTLRRVLGDDARQPRYIQTIPKRGYRLVASVGQAPRLSPPEKPDDAPPIPPSSGIRLKLASRAARRGWAWVSVATFGLATFLGLVLLSWGRTENAPSTRVSPRVTGSKTSVQKESLRIAVLPFEDLGRPGDPFFSIGLTQELTKDLGSLPSLQVICRTIVTKDVQTRPPGAIASGLGVDYVMIGSLQWASRPGGGSRVRIRPQLIRVDGVQVWADSFDSDVQDIFEVQAEISRRVIASLGISLLPAQSAYLREPATKNLGAYQAYLRGLSLKDQPFYSEEYLSKAALTFRRAVELDPEFAAAWAQLSLVHSYLAYNTDATQDRVRAARQALEQAMSLATNLPEVRLARAYYTYRCLEDFDGALAQLADSAQLFPNDAETFKILGLLLRRKGRLREAVEALRHAEWLNPSIGELAWILPETQRALRNFEEADHGFAQATSQAPDEPFFWEQRVLNLLAWTGDPSKARRLLASAGMAGNPVIEAVAFRLDLYAGDLEGGLRRLSPVWVQQLPPEAQARINMVAAIIRERLGDHKGAQAAAESNRADLAEKLAHLQDHGLFHACLAVALAQLGRHSEAFAHAEQAAKLSQVDAFSGPRIGEIEAIVELILGRRQEAIARLGTLLRTPYRGSITTTDLRLDPVWRPLVDEAAFEDLLGR